MMVASFSRPPPARTTVFPLPLTSQATPRRGETQSPAGVIFGGERRARAELLNRRSRRRVHVGIEVANVVVAFRRRRVVLVAQTEVQGDSGVEPPIILSENSEPVSSACLLWDCPVESIRSLGMPCRKLCRSRKSPCLALR